MTAISKADQQVEQKCLEFAQVLGLSEPVSPRVLQAATEDETYANNLLVSRQQPTFLNYLLANPPQIKLSEPVPEEKSNLELVGKAGQALLRWAKTGFSVVDDGVLERRENACLACPNLLAPEKLVQKLIPSGKVSQKVGQRTGDKVCQLCGCNVGKKIRLTTESCPDKHPSAAGMTRWGEPLGKPI